MWSGSACHAEHVEHDAVETQESGTRILRNVRLARHSRARVFSLTYLVISIHIHVWGVPITWRARAKWAENHPNRWLRVTGHRWQKSCEPQDRIPREALSCAFMCGGWYACTQDADLGAGPPIDSRGRRVLGRRNRFPDKPIGERRIRCDDHRHRTDGERGAVGGSTCRAHVSFDRSLSRGPSHLCSRRRRRQIHSDLTLRGLWAGRARDNT